VQATRLEGASGQLLVWHWYAVGAHATASDALAKLSERPRTLVFVSTFSANFVARHESIGPRAVSNGSRKMKHRAAARPIHSAGRTDEAETEVDASLAMIRRVSGENHSLMAGCFISRAMRRRPKSC
jgi:hypothetical protein